MLYNLVLRVLENVLVLINDVFYYSIAPIRNYALSRVSSKLELLLPIVSIFHFYHFRLCSKTDHKILVPIPLRYTFWFRFSIPTFWDFPLLLGLNGAIPKKCNLSLRGYDMKGPNQSIFNFPFVLYLSLC
jgi:hypothetical protein